MIDAVRLDAMRSALRRPALQLVGLHCRRCGTTAFPVHDACPRCGSLAVDETPLAATGRIEAVTTTPDAQVCEVRLDDGVLVLGALELQPRLHVGARVRHVPDGRVIRFRSDD